MCGPAIPFVLMTAATAATAMSQFQQARGDAAQYEREAIVARQQAVFESQRQQRDLTRKLASLHAHASGSGVQSGSGTPLDIAANFAAEGQLEPFETIRQGLIQFQDLRFAAKRTKSAATADLIGSGLHLGSTITARMPFFQ